MSSSRRIIVYSILRLLLFVVPFIIFMLLRIEWWVSAILATIVAVCLSYLFLRRQRDEIAATVQTWGKGDRRDPDNELENAALDRLSESGRDEL